MSSYIIVETQMSLVKLLTQNSRKLDVYEEMIIQNLKRIVSQKQEGPRQSDY